MAAFQLRAPAPAAVAAASRISRPFHGALNVHPLGRRGPSSSPVKLQARTGNHSFRSHCEKRADRLNEPDPEPENHDPDKAETLQKHHPLVEELLKYKQELFAASGVRETPDMFLKEKEQISGYMKKLSRSTDSSRRLDERVVSEIICLRAEEALDWASKVMDIARDGSGTTEFSQHTTDQMVRTYATIFYNVADDAYHKKIGAETALSFLGALRGLGAICHILVQDTVAKLKDGHLKDEITHTMDTQSHEFHKKVNNLEDEVARITEQKLQQMLTTMLLKGLDHAGFYIFLLMEGHKLALDDL